MLTEVALTTADNPYNPFTDWDRWYQFDESKGYHSASLLARVVVTSDELSDADQQLAIENAVDEIVKTNTLGIYRKVSRPLDTVSS